MIITSNGIEFTNLKEFSKFTYDNGLVGVIQLTEPIKDNGGNILIKEMVSVKETAIKKLENLDGQFTPLFKVNLNDDLINRLSLAISKRILPQIESAKNLFLKHLFEHNSSFINNFASFIKNSFYETKILLIFYRLMVERPEYFDYGIDNALTCLGTVIQKSHQVKFIHRHAFLGGFFLDIALSETDYFKFPYPQESDLIQVSKLSGIAAANVGLSKEIVVSIENSNIPGIYTEGSTLTIDYETLEKNPLLKMSSEGGDSGEIDMEAEQILTESFKISRFIKETYKKMDKSKDDVAEQLLVMFTYNTEKGVFLKEYAYPIIARFKEFQATVNKVRKVASIENKCPHQPSAWAYPKPKSTQILCKNRIYECKYFVGGWDINIVSAQSSFGYLGTPLNPGSYPKCKLEKELDNS
ncbi:MAG: hypothetical protein H7A24_04995 [Leptospiraceae bacterium]|nr:hypothetical protein [Leptospiraceae bacterium]MCP5511213.1 hypothetical protein [Leptospiraceae bacterium]